MKKGVKYEVKLFIVSFILIGIFMIPFVSAFNWADFMDFMRGYRGIDIESSDLTGELNSISLKEGMGGCEEIKGGVIYRDKVYYNSCKKYNFLKEYYCKDSRVHIRVLSCNEEGFCSYERDNKYGECEKLNRDLLKGNCYDEDGKGLMSEFIKSKTFKIEHRRGKDYISRIYEDVCYKDILYEYECKVNSVRIKRVNCKEGCDNGACIAPAPIIEDNLYFVNSSGRYIYYLQKVSPDGTMEIVGVIFENYNPIGVTALDVDVAVNSKGEVYYDSPLEGIYKIDSQGQIEVVVPKVEVSGLVIDSNDNLYFVNSSGRYIYYLQKVSPDGTMEIVGVIFENYNPIGVTALDVDVAVNSKGEVYYDSPLEGIYKIDSQGQIEVVVPKVEVSGLVIDSNDNLYFVNSSGRYIYYLQKVSPDGTMEIVGVIFENYNPIGVTALDVDVAVNSKGEVYYDSPLEGIYKIDSQGQIEVVVPKVEVSGLVIDSNDNLYFVNSSGRYIYY